MERTVKKVQNGVLIDALRKKDPKLTDHGAARIAGAIIGQIADTLNDGGNIALIRDEEDGSVRLKILTLEIKPRKRFS